jgi:tetratricopeptide (TPR) repeat protein
MAPPHGRPSINLDRNVRETLQVWSMDSDFESIPPADGTTSVDSRMSLDAAAEEARRLIDEGRLVRRTGDRTGSLQVFRQAVKVDPTNAVAVIECGYDHLDLVQIPEAREAFEQGLALEVDNRSALFGLGHTFRHLRDLDQAERCFRRILELEPDHVGAHMGLGHTLRSLDRREEALDCFQSAAKSNPTNAAALVEASHLLRDLGRSDEAISVLREIVAREPSNSDYLLTLARLLKQTGRPEQARETFEKLINEDCGNVSLRVEFGYTLLEVGELDEAQKLLAEVLREAPENPNALNALAWVHRKAKNLDLAADCFRKLSTLQSANLEPLHALGMIEREKGNYASALQYIEQARQKDPKALYVRLEVGHCLQHLAHFQKAIAEFDGIIKEWPAESAAYLGLGHALRGAGQFHEALAAFEEASRIDPAFPNGMIEAGHLLLRLERSSEAAERFRGALKHSHGNASALVGLSHALRSLGRLEEAENAVREALVANPDNTGARIAVGYSLIEQHRLEEAVNLFAEVVARQPNHADAHAALGHIYRHRGDRQAALASFRLAAEADPNKKIRLIDVATELGELGNIDESGAVLDEVLAAAPADARALMQRGQLLRRLDRREEALSVFTGMLAHNPDHSQAMVEAATEERALGRPEQAKEWLNKALTMEPNQVGALFALAEIAMQSDEPEEALRLYRRAAASHPTNVWVWLGEARAAFELGDRQGAFRIIAEARARFGAHPAMVAMEVEFLGNLRDWPRARAAAEAGLTDGPRPNFWTWWHKVKIATLTGRYAEAAMELEKAPFSGSQEQARVFLLRGQLAEAQFCYDDAIGHYRESIRLDPSEPWAHSELARAALMNLDIDTSRSALGVFIRVSRSSLLLKRLSLSPSQNHVGQLLDEFELDPIALSSLRRIRQSPLETQLGPLRDSMLQHPEHTPTAIIVAIALRQSRQFLRPKVPGNGVLSPIPRHIVQFWDREPPEDVCELMTSWQTLNPDHRWTCFSEVQANDFLREEFGHDVLQAFRRTRIPAQKADLFRLAWLTARGGIYVDADDRCLEPLDNYVRSEATLVVHQENFGSMGNNFIAVTPEHPVIVRALEMATIAINRGDTDLIWLCTGPGLFTRSFALEWASERPGGLLRRTEVLDLGELQSRIGIHCPVRYKFTAQHWSRAAFQRERRSKSQVPTTS